MNKARFMVTALSLFFCLCMNAQKLYVGTYNIRYNNPDDAEIGNGWKQRCPNICDLINFEQPVIFGTQEVLHDQLLDLSAGLKGYSYIGIGREDGKEKGEYSAIFYNADQLQLLRNGNFWLSQTPDKPSKGWDAACERICTWGQFKDKSTKLKFFFFNCHMDHVGVEARRNSAKMLVDSIKSIAKGAPAILTGDFNVDQNDEVFKILSASGILKDCYTYAEQRMAPCGTWNDFM
ncbi:MAG: endonuclease/exonuclease/phosphatase family protein, partial [Prevotella sp.]